MEFDLTGILQAINTALQFLALFLGSFIAALWISLVVWTFRDIRSRSRDPFAWLLATLLVLALNLLGLFLYMILRPKETLAESYERALEEEALLQGLEERNACPECGQRIEAEFVLCPNCRTRLKQPCRNCGHLLQLKWDICPYCGYEDSLRRPVKVAEPEAEVASTLGAESPHTSSPTS